MDAALQQAIADFEAFLSGQKAPALVGYSLAAVMKNDVRTISHIVVGWAMRQSNPQLAATILFARNKVFDIFFYRVVKFDGIYNFFPNFEATLVQFCPPPHQPHLAHLFQQNPWSEIRPIGELKQQPVFALETRTEVGVQEEKFNENVYKNVTHNIIGAENRYTFADEQTGQQIAQYSARVENLFRDFVGLVKDQQARKEIFIANEADKDAVYENKKRFNIEDYVIQCVDLAGSFFNDDYLLQCVQMMDMIVELARERSFSLENNNRFQAKSTMFSIRKIEEYTTGKTNRFLVKNILGLFQNWYPIPLLDQLQVEENRRVRRVYLNVLESYGAGIYPTILDELAGCTDQTPWYYVRNLIYLLGRIVTADTGDKLRAVELTDAHLNPQSVRQVNLQCILTLAALGTDQAADRLNAKLQVFKKLQDAVSVDFANKIALALIGFESERVIEPAAEHALQHWSNEFSERFSQVNLPPRAIAALAAKIRAEAKKMRFTFSLFGNAESASNLLKAIGQSRSDEVTNLCRELVKMLPASNPLHVRANNILEQVQPPPVILAEDKQLNRLAIAKNIPEAVCYIHEAALGGKLRVRSNAQGDGFIEFDHGEIVRASGSMHYLDQENAFYWSFLLEPRDIGQVTFTQGATGALGGQRIETPSPQLIQEGLLQKGEVQQIVGSALLPDSKFSQRKVGAYFLQFKGAPDPRKCRLVWDELVSNPDINTLQQTTKLSKYELYKILFYLMKQNMIVVDADKRPQEGATYGDGFTMLEIYLQRIARKPVMFNNYKASAEICEEIVKASPDEVVKFSMEVLRKYYWNAYAGRRVFSEANLAVCAQVVSLVTTYLRAKTPTNKEALLSYINFSFQEQDLSLSAPPPPEPATTVLQKLENIELANDAFDDVDAMFDEDAIDGMFGALDATLNASGTDIPSVGMAGTDTGLTAYEEEMLKDLYDNIAMAYVKPVKDFIREVQLNQRARRQTSLEWIEMVEPSVNLLYGSAEKMGYAKICAVLAEVKKILESQKAVPDQTYLTDQAVHAILHYYGLLTQMLPKTFALELNDSDLNSKKEVLIVKFILKQIPELTEKHLNRIILAGLSTFDKFMHSSPDEIAAVTGLSKKQGEDVFMKFYQYRHIYYRHNDEDYKDRFVQMYEVKLNILGEIHHEVESLLTTSKTMTDDIKARIEGLKADRQRTLQAIFILLTIKEEYDLIESVQQSVFDVRLQKLEEYMNRLAAA